MKRMNLAKIVECLYLVTKSKNMKRMNLAQLVQYFKNRRRFEIAEFFASLENDPIVVDGLIEKDYVTHFLGCDDDEAAQREMREIECEVTTYIGCNK
jgi:hypothetical protein